MVWRHASVLESQLGVDAGEAGHVGGEVEVAMLGDDAVDSGDRGFVGDVEGGDGVARGEVGGDHRSRPCPRQLDGRGADAPCRPSRARPCPPCRGSRGEHLGLVGEEDHDAVDVDEGGLVGLDLSRRTPGSRGRRGIPRSRRTPARRRRPKVLRWGAGRYCTYRRVAAEVRACRGSAARGCASSRGSPRGTSPPCA